MAGDEGDARHDRGEQRRGRQDDDGCCKDYASVKQTFHSLIMEHRYVWRAQTSVVVVVLRSNFSDGMQERRQLADVGSVA